MEFNALQIAAIIGGKVEGDPEATVNAFGKIEEAEVGQLSFLANPKYEDFLYTTGASIVIVSETLALKEKIKSTLIRVADPYSAFANLLTAYQEKIASALIGIEQPSHIDASAKMGEDVFVGAFAYVGKDVAIGKNVKIYPQVYIGDQVRIGDNTILYPGVIIYHGCSIGSGVRIHAGTVIGSDGFGFAPQGDGSFKKVPQMGNVLIEDQVEIGANCSIDRATIGSTIIRRGAKLDNFIQIAHNVEVGANTVIAAQAGISGSTKVGSGVMIGGQAGIVGHITIADGSHINAQSGVSKSIKTPGKAVTGSPAHDYTEMLRSQAVFRKLPEMEKRIAEL
ncbi:MAG: UDP-3-O-(3-hydroxymyristoyl)glucosamine N-acyltransferase, partial [Bacteroidetes bacterium]|nr:UDP-3-O-(3-hydroxymyristoyl)glucosamine N-acyltransferase [Bacteroidota bacterium]